MRILSLLLILTLFSCKSTKQTTEVKKNVKQTVIDNSTKKTQLEKIDISFDEITIVAFDPTIETQITDSKGQTKTFKNVKSITIKKQKESKKAKVIEEVKDVKTEIVDKTEIVEEKESISDANNYKWIFISIGFIFMCSLIGYLVFKFKR